MRAADAIHKAITASAPEMSSRHVEILEHTNSMFQRLYSKAYLDVLDAAPALYGWYYDEREKWAKHDRLRPAFNKLNTRSLVKQIEEHQPDVTICTHPMPAEIITWLIHEGRLKTQQAVVVTDCDIHVQWLCPNDVHYFVAIDEARAHLEALGIAPSDITVSGIPIDPVFAEPKDSAAMRNKHGLRRDATVILISAGGFGVGAIEEIVNSLRRMSRPTQVVVICGRNEELKARLDEIAGGIAADSLVEIKVVGFTTAMDEYMAAADLIVGKPGGLTMSEALACGLVFVIVSPIPGQEERNADHLLEEGAAIRCNNLPVLAYKIERLLDDPQRLAAMRQNVRRLARPQAAFDIAATFRNTRTLNVRDAPN